MTLGILLLTPLLFGQSNDTVKHIREIVEQINTDTAYTTRTIEGDQWMEHTTDGGGYLTGYFKQGQLVKIVELVGLSSCTLIYEYYFQDDNLIFVYGQEKNFEYVDSLASFDYTTQTLAMEFRFYFESNNLIKSKITQRSKRAMAVSETQALELLAESKRFQQLLKN